MNIHQIITEEIATFYRQDQTEDEAVSNLVRRLSTKDMAGFIVEAFNRGWITRRNLGIDDEGNII